MKTLDILAAVLLIVGGINWGLVGLADFDFVAAVFGTMSGPSRLAYALVGLAALYQAALLPVIQRRWGVSPARA